MKNLVNQIKEFFDKSAIKFHVENRNYEVAEKLAKLPRQKNYLLNIYYKKGLNLLFSDFYTNSN